MGKVLAIIIFFALILGFSLALSFSLLKNRITKESLSNIKESQTISKKDKNQALTSIIASNLKIPWAMAFLPDGSMLFTQRSGTVSLIDKNGNLAEKPIAEISEVKEIGEGGLLGITVHPNFSSNHFVYLYYTYSANDFRTKNRVVRFVFEDQTLKNKSIIVDQIPGAIFHNGGRLKFGPDNFLYITTGDAQKPSEAQNTSSLAGKILRVTDDGKPAPGNPFKTLIYSYGHRNPQGLTWDKDDNLWETEHGNEAKDEINIISSGKNYGWPIISGDKTQEGMTAPILNSGDDTWAPSGMAYYNGSLYFAGLRGQALFEAVINGKSATLKEHLKGSLGRIRDVVVGPDNFLYVTTSNRDGRGNPAADDDKIIRINPEKL